MKTANVLLVKEINQHLIRKQLLSLKAATKQQLAQLTGLSLMTVNSIITEMLERREVFEGNMIPSNGGRPSAEYCYNGGYGHAVILYAHQKNNQNFICMRVLDLLGSCRYSEEQYFDTVLCDGFDEMMERAFAMVGNIGVIGFGLPGEEDDSSITISDYPDLIGKDFIQRYRERYKVPVVFVNDINAAVFGYYQRSSERNGTNGTVAGLYFPRLYRPGMGLIIDGSIYHGSQHFAGEIGYLPFGVEWDRFDYENKAALYGSVAHLLAIVCCTVAPEKLILYGDFFTEEDAPCIKTKTEKRLHGGFSVHIETSTSFETDYEYGLATVVLEALYTALFGKYKGV
ncbi:ROK family protein [Hydrogenoanaerobacterium sp.]|uniref:ROK family protein n=1 Tax=Hydrogenoanaerobacterium sp. TaxID=2953763 RepID=UPI00289D5ECF|nr:ROK family protein [Hydrogenoanaerobacterium sp.]